MRLGSDVGNVLVVGVARAIAAGQLVTSAPGQAAWFYALALESFQRQADVVHLLPILRHALPLLLALDETVAVRTIESKAVDSPYDAALIAVEALRRHAIPS